MGRIVVKNLPKRITSERVREIFSSKGDITDLQLKYTKSGVFRRFAFIGYSRSADAASAIDFFHNTFIDASRIQVTEAKDIAAPEKPRPWSKYSKGSTAYQRKHEKPAKSEKKEKTQTKKSDKDAKQQLGIDLGELQDDPEFQEFLEVHRSVDQKQTWANDGLVGQKVKIDEDGDGDDDDDDDDDDEVTEANRIIPDEEEEEEKTGKKKKKKKKKQKDKIEEAHEREVKDVVEESPVSDMEYLRSKMVKKKESSSKEEEGQDKSPPAEDGGETEEKNSASSNGSILTELKTTEKYSKGDHTVRVTGMQRNFTEKDIVKFFEPLKIKIIRSILNANGRRKGKLYVEFFSEEDVTQALTKHKQYLGTRYLQVIRDGPNQSGKGGADHPREDDQTEKLPWQQQAEELSNADEQVAETGRLFLRNLAYVCKEEDLEQLFSTYGPLTEVNLPIDKFTKKSKGFAFITFMMPEHAVKAYTDLDGKDFMGRLMHILPGKEKITKEVDEKEGSSYKNQKAAKQKALSGSSHNWNTLFIGSNAVADALASKYNTAKRDVLNPDTKGSLGVRMALGETQIVAETRQFLVENGVALDSFSQPSAPRSKTVMIAKNLPAGTSPEELTELFAPHGQLGKVLLPPAGVTAIIEMLEPSEARMAFYNLAYTKFHHVPLYLEWAPMDVFGGNKDTKEEGEEGSEATDGDKLDRDEKQSISEKEGDRKPDEEMMKIGDEDVEDEEEEEDEELEDDAEPESTLFVKNINFETVEDTLQEAFSKCGKVKSVVISRKKDPYKSEELLSMGFGFVEYFKRDHAMKALKELQHIQVDGHQIELKISNRTTLRKKQVSGRKSVRKKQPSSKIMVRNIPFEAQAKEIKDLFSTFGEIKYVRLPKKMSGTGTHRGFGFVEFLTKQDAKRAFDALCHSSHLFGRRLVLEWADQDESVDRLRKRTADHFSDAPVKKQLKKSKLKEDLMS